MNESSLLLLLAIETKNETTRQSGADLLTMSPSLSSSMLAQVLSSFFAALETWHRSMNFTVILFFAFLKHTHSQ